MLKQEIFDLVVPGGQKVRELYSKRKTAKTQLSEIERQKSSVDKILAELLAVRNWVYNRYLIDKLPKGSSERVAFKINATYLRSSLEDKAIKAYARAYEQLKFSMQDKTYKKDKESILDGMNKLAQKYIVGDHPCSVKEWQEVKTFLEDIKWVLEDVEKLSQKYDPKMNELQEGFQDVNFAFVKQGAKSAAVFATVAVVGTALFGRIPYVGTAVKKVIGA